MLDKIEILERVVVHYSVQNGGDGSAYPAWFLTQEDAEFDQANMYEGWGEDCSGSVETFIGSDIHAAAVRASAELYISKTYMNKPVKDLTDYIDSQGLKYFLYVVDGKAARLPKYTRGLILINVTNGDVTDISSW